MFFFEKQHFIFKIKVFEKHLSLRNTNCFFAFYGVRSLSLQTFTKQLTLRTSFLAV